MDGVDKKLLALLEANARATFAELGAAVGLSAPASKRRVDKLVAEGIIKGFTTRLDHSKLGHRVEAFVELFCRGTVSPQEIARILGEIPEVVEASTVSGSADATVHIMAADIAALERAIERIRSAPMIDHSQTTIVLSKVIDRKPA